VRGLQERWAVTALTGEPVVADGPTGRRPGLRHLGVALAVVSLGADGAVFVTAEAAIHASAPPMVAASTVGAGDAMVAGILAAMAEDAGLERIARLGTAFAVCKLAQVGPNLPGRDVVEACARNVEVREVR